MANTISGGIYFAGIGSGNDFDTMIKQLAEVEGYRKKNLESWKSDWQTRIDAFQDIMDTMREARESLSSLRSLRTLLSKAVDSTTSSVATAKADASIAENSYSINVKQLATSAVFSNKTNLNKTDSINDTGVEQVFSYTYKGKEMTYKIQPGMTLEQLTNTINGDAKNPGVRASLVKSGTNEYIFQIQGRETGKDASLSISSSLPALAGNRFQFAGADATAVGKTQLTKENTKEYFKYTFEGKDYSLEFESGSGLQKFVDTFNADAKKPADLKAVVEDNGDGTFSLGFQQVTGSISNPVDLTGVSSSVASLAGKNATFSTRNPVLNPKPQENFVYEYEGQTYTVDFDSGSSPKEFVSAFNKAAAAEGNSGLRAVFTEVNDGSGKGKITFEAKGLNGRYADVTADVHVDDTLTTVDELDNLTVAFAKDAKLGSQIGPDQTFRYVDNDGNTREITLPAGGTLDSFVKAFNADAKEGKTGITASVREDKKTTTVTDPVTGQTTTTTSVQYLLEFKTADGKQAKLNDVSTDIAGLQDIGPYAYTSKADDPIGTASPTHTYSFSYEGKDYSIAVEPGDTVDDFLTKFNDTVGVDFPHLKAELKQTKEPTAADSTTTPPTAASPGSGMWQIKIYDVSDPDDKKEVLLDNVKNTVPGLNGLDSDTDAWYERQAQDAVFTLNGFDDQVFTSSTNTLTEVIDGMEITLKGTGETTLTVSTDSSELKDKVKEFVDTVNTVLEKIKKLTNVDTEKSVLKPEKASSQFDMQMGSVLTGNYGVQLLSTRLKNIMATAGIGFDKNDDTVDPFATLGQIGIKFVSDESDPKAGLLTIDDAKLDEAIEKDPSAVARLLAADKSGSTDSTAFTFAATGPSTKAGTYGVRYVVDEDGNLSEVYINGVRANADSDFPGRYTVGDTKNPAAGLAIEFPSTTGMVPGEYKDDKVFLRQGKAGEMYDQLSAELVDLEGAENRGALPVLISNYKDIIKNIDKKIDRETDRIDQWTRRMKLKFAKLDALLGTYDKQLQTNEKLLAQAKSNSSSS